MSPRVISKTPASAEQRRQELLEANAKIDEAEALGHKLEDQRRDVSRMEQQRDALAALGDDRLGARRGSRELDRAAATGGREHREPDRGAAGMTPRDPFSVAAANEAARISAAAAVRD